MKIYVFQERGNMRDKLEMEDRVVINGNLLCEGFHVCEAEDAILAVMDGVGGHAGSAYAATKVGSALISAKTDISTEALHGMLWAIHQELYAHTQTATTATGLIKSGDVCRIFHAGNTRIYFQINGYICQKTQDQTEGDRLMHTGISEDQIPRRYFNILNTCVGIRKEMLDGLVIRDVSEEFRRATRLLLCSDGLHDYVPEETLEQYLSGELSRTSMRSLAETARVAGSEDDISIIIAEV